MFVLATCIGLTQSAKHAVLIAGSSGWSNYRHQADIAHAYKILSDGGVPKENIVTLMYDDVAKSLRNKFRGQLFNRPDSPDGTLPPDVYASVKDHIDYQGHKVTPKRFLQVLTGDEKAGGAVLKSGPDDDVFVYFADHGGVGILGFPALLPFPPGVFSQVLHADDLNAALVTMHSKSMYKRLTFYVEACESGSIFEGLLNTSLGIYAVTAANAKESSWGWYCDDESGGKATVHGKNLGVCLGDEFSVKWMEDTDRADETIETLAKQFNTVRAQVNKSHVQHFGDLTFTGSPLEAFLGNEGGNATGYRHAPNSAADARIGARVGTGVGVDSRDAKLLHLKWQLRQAWAQEAAVKATATATAMATAEPTVEGGSAEEEVAVAEEAAVAAAERELREEEESRAHAEALFGRAWTKVTGLSSAGMLERYHPPRRFDCHKQVLRDAAVRYTDYSMRFHRAIVNMCEMGHSAASITAGLIG